MFPTDSLGRSARFSDSRPNPANRINLCPRAMGSASKRRASIDISPGTNHGVYTSVHGEANGGPRRRRAKPLCPHKWVVDGTFEWEFDLTMPVNSAYQPKPKPTAKKTIKAVKACTSERSSAKPDTTRTAQPKASKKPKKVRLTPEELKERLRFRSAEQRRRRKALRLCKDCPEAAIPGRTRLRPALRNTGNRGSAKDKHCTPEAVRGFATRSNGGHGVGFSGQRDQGRREGGGGRRWRRYG